MNKKQLWDSILQQAISGKLVPQMDSEPAVEQIGPAPAKEDEPFALPKKWKWVRLKSLAAHIQYGYTASASDSGEVKLLRIKDLHEGKVNWDSVPFCSISSADIAKFKLLPNDIVIARSGTVGKSFKVGQIEHEAVFASYLIRIGLNDKLPVSASYIKTYLDSPTYWYSIFQSARGTAMKNVNAQQLGALLIPLPPLEEQRRIVAKLDELKPLIDQFGETYDKLSELEADFPRKLKASILQAAMQGKLVPQLDSEPAVEQIGPALDPDDVPFELPEEWKWVQLENLCTYMQRGKSPKYSDIKRYPVVAQKCNQWDGLHLELALFFDPSTLSSYKAERFLQQDDVLLNSTGTGTLGRVGSYDKEANPYELAVADSHVTVIRAKFSCLMPYYLKFVLRSDIFQRKLIAAGTGTTKQQELALSKVKQLWIPLPPLEEQRRIVARIEELFAEVDKMSSCKAP